MVDEPLTDLELEEWKRTAKPSTTEFAVVRDDIPGLAQEVDVLERFDVAIRAAGVIGEGKVAKLEYLAITSRLLDKPVSLVVKGGSSSGKSFTTEAVSKFFPPKAVLPFTGMSEKALILSSRSFEHRTIIIYEATALRERAEKQSGDQTAYYLRSLVSEGETHYEMSVRDKDGGWSTKRFEKHGPTNVIVTTTAVSLHNENETRMLSLQTNDRPEQTAAILEGLADETEGVMDYRPWHELQDWLFAQDNRVTIPFRHELVRAIPPVALRLRRDIGAVLSLIRASAILHQATRDRDDQDQIVATEADYEVVRDLVIDVISQGVGATVSATIRDTVAAVDVLAAQHPDGVPAAAVGLKLGLDKSAAWRRLHQAADAGYLVNQEERRGRPGRYVVGEPMPDDITILPPTPLVHTPSEPTATVQPPPVPVRPRNRAEGETAGQADGCMVASDSEGVKEVDVAYVVDQLRIKEVRSRNDVSLGQVLEAIKKKEDASFAPGDVVRQLGGLKTREFRVKDIDGEVVDVWELDHGVAGKQYTCLASDLILVRKEV
jgi:hypothetical protein